MTAKQLGEQPAYPTRMPKDSAGIYDLGGLTIRQEFVKAAMQGLCVNYGLKLYNPEYLAACAVTVADATLKLLAEESP